jgi:hypothetical protein
MFLAFDGIEQFAGFLSAHFTWRALLILPLRGLFAGLLALGTRSIFTPIGSRRGSLRRRRWLLFLLRSLRGLLLLGLRTLLGRTLLAAERIGARCLLSRLRLPG